MDPISLIALTHQHQDAARSSASGRSAHTVYGGHEHTLRQTLIALAGGRSLAEHNSPGEATLHVLHGEVRLASGEQGWDGVAGDLLVIPDAPHSVAALSDAVVLLTTVVR